MKYILILFLLLNGCTAAIISMNECKKACGGNMTAFEMNGDQDNLSCQCRVPKHTIYK